MTFNKGHISKVKVTCTPPKSVSRPYLLSAKFDLDDIYIIVVHDPKVCHDLEVERMSYYPVVYPKSRPQ